MDDPLIQWLAKEAASLTPVPRTTSRSRLTKLRARTTEPAESITPDVEVKNQAQSPHRYGRTTRPAVPE